VADGQARLAFDHYYKDFGRHTGFGTQNTKADLGFLGGDVDAFFGHGLDGGGVDLSAGSEPVERISICPLRGG
jgi:hypothetical protein